MIEQTIFLIQFIVFLTIIIIEILNVMNWARNYDLRYSFMAFFVMYICTHIGKTVFLLNVENLFYASITMLQSPLFKFYWLIFAVEVLFLPPHHALKHSGASSDSWERCPLRC